VNKYAIEYSIQIADELSTIVDIILESTWALDNERFTEATKSADILLSILDGINPKDVDEPTRAYVYDVINTSRNKVLNAKNQWDITEISRKKEAE